MFWKTALAAAALIVAGGSAPLRHLPRAAPLPRFDGTLSVLTYNVKGLPWPIASGRAADLAVIGERLRDLRRRGQAPHVVVLQEAFTQDAREIGQAAGYRYRIDGTSDTATGKFVGSGLQILSDYPMVDARRIAFGDAACAGYDCLANKGAVAASIVVPGVATHVAIATTHLNSRTASGVAPARADRAYAAQVAALGDFLSSARRVTDPLIVAGDFNVGRTRFRRTVLAATLAARWHGNGSVKDALPDAMRRNMTVGEDAATARRRGKDHQFFVAGSAARLDLAGIAVPFGHDPDGTMLSDHVGWIAYYRIVPR